MAQLAAGDDIAVRMNMRGHVTTSATVLSPTFDRVLLIHHRVFNEWLPPGGHYEPPDSLWGSAVRETTEETGLRNIDRHPWTVCHDLPIDIDTHPIPANVAKGEGPHVHHDFRFLAVAPDTAQLVAELSEVSEVRWAYVGEMRDSPDERVRALHEKLSRLGIFGDALQRS
ncbi:NUDIX hydrolase [Ideonella sp. A 288]|uniref:NUDIX hydrolase n=1 Tax=Ideonella sp. A 288 TaxID=1962181 RepID=UPI0013035220|nr:NUDIX domain-containing protein [Ideonella sp. A 288]